MGDNVIEQADAEQAYIQARIRGTPTWVRLPRHRWPKRWHSMKLVDPVCLLKLALYGHPQSGGFWEEKAEGDLHLEGFEDVPEWKSCFWHPELKVFLVLYVDDFKLSGPSKNMKAAWTKIRRRIKTGEPHCVENFLGCQHEIVMFTPPGYDSPVRAVVYNM